MTQPPKILGKGKYLQLCKQGRWEYVERVNALGAVVICGLTKQQAVVLVEQFRPALERRVVEFPAGLIGDKADFSEEDAEAAGRREFLEETGYEAEEFTLLTEGPPSSGLSNEMITFYLARGLKKVSGGGGDASEAIELHTIPLKSIDTWLDEKAGEGILIDPKVFAGLYFLHHSLTRPT